MLGRGLTALIDAQDRWAKPLGDWIHGILAALFGRMTTIRDLLAGTWLGHPLHALLTDVPIGAFTLVIVLDVAGQRTAADLALAVGILVMAAAAIAGLADYSTTDGKARVRATVHGVLMVVALVAYLVSFGLRAGASPTADRTPAEAISVIAYLVLAAGAFVGGDVAYALGNMVDRHAWRPAGSKWQPIEVGDLPEGQLVKAKLGQQALVLIRQGETILALHDQCAHAGGPLSGGTVVGDCVECPWHGSRFRLSDGRRQRGPAVYDQPAYEVRPVEGGAGYEGRRTS